MTKRQKSSQNEKRLKPTPLTLILAFVLGCFCSATLILNAKLTTLEVAPSLLGLLDAQSADGFVPHEFTGKASSYSSLQSIRILIAVAAYDFSQIPHLEELLDSYQDLCVTDASKVELVIHATGESFVKCVQLSALPMLTGFVL